MCGYILATLLINSTCFLTLGPAMVSLPHLIDLSIKEKKAKLSYFPKPISNFSCLEMSSAEAFASNPEDMVVDSVQKQLEAARLKSNQSTTTVSTVINNSPRSSASSRSGTSTASIAATGSGVAQTSTTLSTQIRKLKNAATAPRILGGGGQSSELLTTAC